MKSMTGYGRGQATCDGSSLTVEIRAVNHKQRDLRLLLPPELAVAEAEAQKLLDGRIARGAVTVAFSFSPAPALRASRLRIDEELATSVATQLGDLATRLGLAATLSAGNLLSIPGILAVAPTCVPEACAHTLVAAALADALAAFDASRQAEGTHLQLDLQANLNQLEALLADIARRQDEVLVHYRDRLLARIRLLDLELKLDDERLAREVAFVAQRADIAEEVTRLNSHLAQFRDLLATSTTPVGRELQFVCQEIHREINTLGSKTNETAIARNVIDFKTILDKLREQIANVE